MFSAVFVGVTWLGIIFVRPFLRLFVRSQRASTISSLHSSCYVCFTAAARLLAVATYQNLSDVDKAVALEAPRSRRCPGCFLLSRPEPHRASGITPRIHRYVIKEACPFSARESFHKAEPNA